MFYRYSICNPVENTLCVYVCSTILEMYSYGFSKLLQSIFPDLRNRATGTRSTTGNLIVFETLANIFKILQQKARVIL